MDRLNQDIIIPVKGLPFGESSFRFEIGEPFFQAFENSQIKDIPHRNYMRVNRIIKMIQRMH